MKGVSYLVNEEGKKTHIVLNLDVWSESWQRFFADDEAALLERGADGLQAELATLERDIPQSDLDEWLTAFNGS